MVQVSGKPRILFAEIGEMYMNKRRKTIIANNQVSRMVTYSLGGYEQKILLDGKYGTTLFS